MIVKLHNLSLRYIESKGNEIEENLKREKKKKRKDEKETNHKLSNKTDDRKK